MKLKTFVIGSGVGFGLYKIIKKYSQIQQLIIDNLIQEIERLKATVTPIKFEIIDFSNNNIQVKIKFYDLDGNIVNDFTFTDIGSNISIDFLVARFSKGTKEYWVAFPSKVFTNETAPADGYNLTPFYEVGKFPQTYKSSNNTAIFNSQIKALWSKIINNDLQGLDVFGMLVQPNNPQKNDEYKIDVHTLGGIELIEI